MKRAADKPLTLRGKVVVRHLRVIARQREITERVKPRTWTVSQSSPRKYRQKIRRSLRHYMLDANGLQARRFLTSEVRFDPLKDESEFCLSVARPVKTVFDKGFTEFDILSVSPPGQDRFYAGQDAPGLHSSRSSRGEPDGGKEAAIRACCVAPLGGYCCGLGRAPASVRRAINN